MRSPPVLSDRVSIPACVPQSPEFPSVSSSRESTLSALRELILLQVKDFRLFLAFEIRPVFAAILIPGEPSFLPSSDDEHTPLSSRQPATILLFLD